MRNVFRGCERSERPSLVWLIRSKWLIGESASLDLTPNIWKHTQLHWSQLHLHLHPPSRVYQWYLTVFHWISQGRRRMCVFTDTPNCSRGQRCAEWPLMSGRSSGSTCLIIQFVQFWFWLIPSLIPMQLENIKRSNIFILCKQQFTKYLFAAGYHEYKLDSIKSCLCVI